MRTTSVAPAERALLALHKRAPCCVVERGERERHEPAKALVVSNRRRPQPFDERPGDARDCTGVTSMQPLGREPGDRTGTSTIQRTLAAYARDSLDHLAIRHHVRSTGVERRAEHVLAAAGSNEVSGDVGEGDRLRRRSRPSAGRSSPADGRRAPRSSRTRRCPAPITIAARRVVTGTWLCGLGVVFSGRLAQFRRCKFRLASVGANRCSLATHVREEAHVYSKRRSARS